MSAKGVALDIGHLIHTPLVKVELIYLQQVNRTILLKKEPYFRKALFLDSPSKKSKKPR